MRKVFYLFTLLCCLLAAPDANAYFSFSYSDFGMTSYAEGAGYNPDPCTIVETGTTTPTTVVLTGQTAWLRGTGLKFYEGSSAEFQAPEGYGFKSIAFNTADMFTIADGTGGTITNRNTWSRNSDENPPSTVKLNSTATSGSFVKTTMFYITLEVAATPSTVQPTFNPSIAQTFEGSLDVTITAEEGLIYYTTDGSTPTSSLTGYSSPCTVTLTGTTNLKAIAKADGKSDSEVTSCLFTAKTARPTFSPNGGEFRGSLDVEITGPEGSTIYYTTDGSTPTTSLTGYSSPCKVTISDSTTIRAIATADGEEKSSVAQASFSSINNLCADNIAAWITLSKATPGALYYISNPVTVTYSHDSQLYVADATGALRVTGESLPQATNGTRIAYLGGKYDSAADFDALTGADFTFAETTSGDTVAPTEVSVGDLEAANENQYVSISAATVDFANNTLIQNYSSLSFTNSFGIELPAEYGKYNVTGIILAHQEEYGTTFELLPISFAFTGIHFPTISATDASGAAVADGATVAEESLPVSVTITNPNEGASMSVVVSNRSNGVSNEYTTSESTYTLSVADSGNITVSAYTSTADGDGYRELSYTAQGEVAYNLTNPYVEFLDSRYNDVPSPATQVPVYMYISHQNYRQGTQLIYTINGEEYTSDDMEVEIELTEPGTIEYTAYVALGTKSKSEVISGSYTIAEDACKLKAPVITFTDPEGDNYAVATITNPNSVGTLFYSIGTSDWYEAEGQSVNLDLTANGTYTIKAYVRNNTNSELNSDITEANYEVDSVSALYFGTEGVSVEGNSIIAPAGAQIYNLNGSRLASGEGLQAGIYIVRLANGKTLKLVVK